MGGERDRDCHGLYPISPPLQCQIAVYHMPSPHKEVTRVFFTATIFSTRLYQQQLYISNSVLCPASLPATTVRLLNLFLNNTTQRSFRPSPSLGATENPPSVEATPATPQHSHITQILMLCKRTDSWKEHRAGISEAF